MTKQSKPKPKYSTISNVAYTLRFTWTHYRFLCAALFVAIPASVLGRLVSTCLPTVIIDSIAEQNRAGTLLAVVFGIFTVQLLVNLVDCAARKVGDYGGNLLQLGFETVIFEKRADLDYEQIIDPKINLFADRLKQITGDYGTAAVQIPWTVCEIFINILNMLLFGGIIGMLNPLIAALLLIPTGINFLFEKNHNKYVYEHREEDHALSKKLFYAACYMQEYCSVKDIIVYRMQHWIDDLTKEANAAYRAYRDREYDHEMIKIFAGHVLTFFRNGIAYVYLIFESVNGRVSPAEFVLYFSIISNFAEYVSGIFTSVSTIHEGALAIGDLREFLEIPSNFNRGTGIPVPTTAPSIVFENVSYTYPSAEKPTLHNLSFTVRPGENIALVGMNGAGKTTLIKLVCGLFRPTEGRILIDGHEIGEYNRDEYYSMITALFQTYSPLPLTIRQNITTTNEEYPEVDEKRLADAIHYADLEDYLDKLPQGIDTRLVKSVCGDATEPSGGEMQRILLARAYYNDRPLLILDEPTSALDPIAESTMYERYAAYSSAKTSLFISHRLVSTRFCDRIILLENGCVAETGSHEELLEKGGRYAQLFNIQSRYYREHPEGDEVD